MRFRYAYAATTIASAAALSATVLAGTASAAPIAPRAAARCPSQHVCLYTKVNYGGHLVSIIHKCQNVPAKYANEIASARIAVAGAALRSGKDCKGGSTLRFPARTDIPNLKKLDMSGGNGKAYHRVRSVS